VKVKRTLTSDYIKVKKDFNQYSDYRTIRGINHWLLNITWKLTNNELYATIKRVSFIKDSTKAEINRP
jgi:hypothetical protein